MKEKIEIETGVDKSSLKQAQNQYKALFASLERQAKNTARRSFNSKSFQDEGFSRGISKGITGISKLTVGLTALVGSSIAATMALKKASDAFKEVELSFSQIKGISGASESDMTLFKGSVKGFSSDFGLKQSEVLSSAKNLAMAGMNIQETEKALKPLLMASRATGTSAEALGFYITNIKEALEYPIDELPKLVDLIVAGSLNANITVEGLGASLSKFASLSKQLGVSAEESVALAGILGDIGTSAEEGGTAIKMFLQRVVEKGEDDEILKKLGIKMTKGGELKRVPEILKEFLEKLKGFSTVESAKIIQKVFGTEVQPKIQAFLNKLDTGRLESFIKKMQESEGTTARIFEDIQGTLSFQQDRLAAIWDNLFISIGDGLSDSTWNLSRKLTEAIIDFEKSFTDFEIEGLKKLSYDISNVFGELISGISKGVSGFLGVVGNLYNKFSSTTQLEMAVKKEVFLSHKDFSLLEDFYEKNKSKISEGFFSSFFGSKKKGSLSEFLFGKKKEELNNRGLLLAIEKSKELFSSGLFSEYEDVINAYRNLSKNESFIKEFLNKKKDLGSEGFEKYNSVFQNILSGKSQVRSILGNQLSEEVISAIKEIQIAKKFRSDKENSQIFQILKAFKIINEKKENPIHDFQKSKNEIKQKSLKYRIEKMKNTNHDACNRKIKRLQEEKEALKSRLINKSKKKSVKNIKPVKTKNKMTFTGFGSLSACKDI